MGITIFGRGYPMSAIDDGTNMQVAYNGTTILDISSSGLSGTFSTIKTTTVTGTTVSGTNISGTTISGTTLCGGTVKAATFCGTSISGFNASAAAGKVLCAYSTAQTISGDGTLIIAISGQTWYVPCFTAAGKQA